jgi:hypothetical protein
MTQPHPHRVLFPYTGNSARGTTAEALWDVARHAEPRA